MENDVVLTNDMDHINNTNDNVNSLLDNSNSTDQNFEKVQGQQNQNKDKNLSGFLIGCVMVMALIFGFIGSFAYDFLIARTYSPNHVTIKTVSSSDGDVVYDNFTAMVSQSVKSVVKVYSAVAAGTNVGSGVLIASDSNSLNFTNGYSYILTNLHVVNGATAVQVELYGDANSFYNAEIVGADASTDLAMIRILKTGLNYATFGNSSNIALGQSVVAIGNPLAKGITVTSGIVSVLNSSIIIDLSKYSLIETDATINQGNSGGGLFDVSGKLIGIINAKSYATNSEGKGYGYAIPANKALEVVQSFLTNVYGTMGYYSGAVHIGLNVKASEININGGPCIQVTGVGLDNNTYLCGIYNFDFLLGDCIYRVDYSIDENHYSLVYSSSNTLGVTQSAVADIISKQSVGDVVTFFVKRGISTYQVNITLNQYIYS